MPPVPSAPGLYVHVPFCSAVCPYCDFAVLVGGPERRTAYVDALAAESALWRGGWTHSAFDTVYLGGGTPSLLAPAELERLLAALRDALPIARAARISLEANPEDVSAPALTAWHALGVETLSLGVQSFDAAALRFLGRRHGPDEARRAVELAMAAGFATVSVDVIFGLPADRESPDGLARTLAEVASLAPDHVSCYQLTFHDGTPFGRGLARGVIRELPDEAQVEAYERVVSELAKAGFAPYEVSNFATAPEHRSRHNAKYWDHTPYLGLGPSAHSFDGRRRWWNERDLAAWSRRVAAGQRPIAEEETLDDETLALEAVMLGLRTVAGIDLARFTARHGIDLVARNQDLVTELVATGLLLHHPNRLAPTLRGLALADGLPAGFEIG